MKKTFVLAIIVALVIALYKWLKSDKEEKQPVEETKAANKETENVKAQAEEAEAEDTVENHK